jgi:PTS system nitrogen regulatory IIA component
MSELNDQNEVMTLAEVADFLQLAEKTILRMAQRGQIPAAKVASQWRFLRSAVKDWLEQQMQIAPSIQMSYVEKNEKDFPGLDEVIRPDLVKTDIKPGSKDEVIKQLISPLRDTGFAQKPDLFLRKTLERERLMTTAVGHGVAVPHPRKPIENMFPGPGIVVGICPEGTDFDAIDDGPVHLFFLICATRDEIHLQLMARIGWLIRDKKILEKLKKAASIERVMEMINRSVKQS